MDAEMKEYLDEMVAAMHAGFSRMEKRFDAVEERLAGDMRQRFRVLNDRVGGIERRLVA